jgi:hypothetical protein
MFGTLTICATLIVPFVGRTSWDNLHCNLFSAFNSSCQFHLAHTPRTNGLS